MAGTDIVKYETTLGTVELSPEIVKKYLVRGNGAVSEQEIVLFLKLCEAQKLNPFVNGEVYLIKYGDKQPASMVVGYDTYKRRAEENPEYLYKESGIVVQRGNEIIKKDGACLYPGEQILGGWCRVHKWKHERDIAIYKECAFREYDKGNSVWKEKPAMMIEKVAISQALREAFPRDFQGLYTPEEIAPKEFKAEDLKPTAQPGGEVIVAEIAEEDRVITQQERVAMFAKAVELCGSKDAGSEMVKTLLAQRGIKSTAGLKLSVYNEIMENLTFDYVDGLDNPFDDDESTEAVEVPEKSAE
ncbi:MAG: phage recombination protein Bet [Clostridia bacterium]|nr:phage recombination protein Bet [Clostridia bacterium]